MVELLQPMDINGDKNIRSKDLYKVFIIILKYIPMIISFCYMLNTILAIAGIDFPLFSMLAGMSILTWIFLYVAAIVFRFCNYHRMFLWYILSSDVINTIDYYVDIPISDYNMFTINVALIGVFLFIILFMYVKSNKKPSDEDN